MDQTKEGIGSSDQRYQPRPTGHAGGPAPHDHRDIPPMFAKLMSYYTSRTHEPAARSNLFYSWAIQGHALSEWTNDLISLGQMNILFTDTAGCS